MWLPIIVCIGVVALLVGPIMLMQPSGADRRLAGLRSIALKHGLRVHMHAIPEGADYQGRSNSLAMYCLPWRHQRDTRVNWLLIRKKFNHEIHAFGCWDWQVEAPESVSANLGEYLAKLPETVVGLVAGAQGLCCIWTERGTEDTVQEIADWLQLVSEEVSLDKV